MSRIGWRSGLSLKKVDENLEMDYADKFQYLLQDTTPKTRARDVVESFPPIGSNYCKAIECLKVCFGREELLVEFYVRELLNLLAPELFFNFSTPCI